jgi:hypothetical protein
MGRELASDARLRATLDESRPTRNPSELSPSGWQVQNEREPADNCDADGSPSHGIGEVVPLQADDADSDKDSEPAANCRDRHAERSGPDRSQRAEHHHSGRRCQREYRRCMPARISELAQVGAVEQVLQQSIVQSDGRRQGQCRKDRAVRPAGEQASQDNGGTQHRCQNRRAGSGEPEQQPLMAVKPGNDRAVNGTIEGVRRTLMRKQYAEDGNQDDAAGQQHAS